MSLKHLSGHGCLHEAVACAKSVVHQCGVIISEDHALRLLQACRNQQDYRCIRQVESLLVQSGKLSTPILADHLIRLFAFYGNMVEANATFNKVAKPSEYTWNSIILAHAKQGPGNLSFCLYDEALFTGVKNNKCMYLAALKACSTMIVLNEGRFIHEQIYKSDFHSDVNVGNTLVDMYAKCGSLNEACRVFDELPHTVVSWNIIIDGHAEHDKGFLALQLFNDMQKEGIIPNEITFSSILKACGSVGAIEQGRCMHEQIIETCRKTNIVVINTLLDMYARCGNMGEACAVFDKLPKRDVASWGAMITGYAQSGNVGMAVVCLESMQHDEIRPNSLVFTAILSACCRTGLVEEAQIYFKSMIECHSINPDVYHCTCMVDLLGHAGYFREAKDILQATRQSNIYTWMVLLTACTIHGNIELGRQCFKKIVNINSNFAPGYVVMSNMYANMEKMARKLKLAY